MQFYFQKLIFKKKLIFKSLISSFEISTFNIPMEYKSSLDYLNSKTFMTLIVPHDQGEKIEIKHLTTPACNKLIMKGSSEFPEYGAIACPSTNISYVCPQNYRTAKNNISKTDFMINIRATRMANFLDKICDHNIIGTCAFVFDDDNSVSNSLIKKMMELG